MTSVNYLALARIQMKSLLLIISMLAMREITQTIRVTSKRPRSHYLVIYMNFLILLFLATNVARVITGIFCIYSVYMLMQSQLQCPSE